MAKYSMSIGSQNSALICKDGSCYEECDVTGIDATWRAVQWDGSNGRAELCDGSNYEVNTGELALTSESEIQVIIDAWQTAYTAEQEAIAAAEAAAAAAEAAAAAGV